MKNVLFVARQSLLSFAGAALLLVSPLSAMAGGGKDLRAAVQNPISLLISLPPRNE
jgi:hypothetical protein